MSSWLERNGERLLVLLALVVFVWAVVGFRWQGEQCPPGCAPVENAGYAEQVRELMGGERDE